MAFNIEHAGALILSYATQKIYDARAKIIKPQTPKKIAIISDPAIGDFIVTMPAMESIKKNYPKSRILLIAPKDLIPLAPKKMETMPLPKTNIEKIETVLKIIKFKPQLIVNFYEPDYPSIILSLLLLPTCQKRVDLSSSLREDKLIKKNWKPTHFNEYASQTLQKEGIKAPITKPKIKSSKTDIKNAKQILKKAGVKKNFAILFPTSKTRKTWPVENFASLIDQIHEKTKLEIIIPTSPENEKTIQEITQQTENKPIILPKTNLETLAAIASLAKIYVGMDTGITHIAAATGCPAVSIFTSGKIYNFYPYTERGAAIYIKKYANLTITTQRKDIEKLQSIEDFDQITPECVMKAILKVLAKKKDNKQQKIPFNGIEC